jgi:hypothetical protein
MESKKVNRLQILIGMAGLLAGLLVYLIDRPPNSTYFLNKIGVETNLHNTLPDIFGRIGYSLPAFLHVFSFILLTAGILSCRKRGYLIICVFWLFVDGAFELGQKYSSELLEYIPRWFDGIPFLENTANFFRLGTFDYVDLIAFSLGTVFAYIVLIITMQRRESS